MATATEGPANARGTEAPTASASLSTDLSEGLNVALGVSLSVHIGLGLGLEISIGLGLLSHIDESTSLGAAHLVGHICISFFLISL